MARSKKKLADSASTPNAWHAAPLLAKLVFLLAVFFLFAGIGIAVDVLNMGRQSTLHFAVSVVLFGLFAVGYAASGVILRGKILSALFPLMLVQFLCMGLVGYWLPDPPAAVSTDATRLQRRLEFDGSAIIASVALGYAGFVSSSIGEARRHIRSQIEKARLESEMDAAREVQRVMVPEDIPSIPGYAIECVYRPATEVGGDFFLVIPLKSGRSLVVIGDVSGKGLRAAMIVSMIVGMLGAVGSLTEEPGQILSELNRRLHGRTHDGFATCLVVRLDEAGTLIMATAGHPLPYLNGRETSLAESMPLGLSENESYAQTSADMRDGDRAVLLTDGIPEARDERGALFGFPRVESLLREGASAKALTEAAQQYGQDDDITVISILRKA